MDVKRPQLLLVTGAYHPEFSAGGLQSRAVARLLADRARFQVLTTATDPALPGRATVDGIDVARVGIRPGARLSVLASTGRMAGELFRALPRVDAVHIQGYSSKNIVVTAMARLWRRPVILHLQTAKHDEPATVRAQGRLAWWAYSTAAAYLSVSPALTARYLEAGLPAAKLREVPNGVDAARFVPASAGTRRALRRQLRLPEDCPLVLFVGVLMPDKQPHVLFDAWLHMRRSTGIASTLVFVGATDPGLYELGDRLGEQLRSAAAASGFGADVHFVPPTAAIEDYFRAADVFAMPSVREGLPIVLLEAMACGLPVVASCLPGSTDTMVESGVNGLLLPPGDAVAWADALAAMLRDPLKAASMGAAARRTVEDRYTMQAVAEQWLAAYHDVLATR